MRLPTFIVFGAIKSGTGALFQYLAHHPEVFTSPIKEPRYFLGSPGDGDREGRRVGSLEQYADLFAGAADNHLALGEASSNYIYSGRAAQRIRDTIPDVKLVASLRNPVDRAIAHLRMSGKRVPTSLSGLRDARAAGWFNSSLYAMHLAPYYELFPESQIRILIVEEWTKDPSASLPELFRFLGVDDAYEVPSNVVYPAGQVNGLRRLSLLRRSRSLIPEPARIMLNRFRARKGAVITERVAPDVRAQLQEWLTSDIDELERRLSRNLAVWRSS